MKRSFTAWLVLTGVLVAVFGRGLGAGLAQEWEMRVCAEANNLPFSNEAGEGFENRIAELIAEELRAEVAYVWLPIPSASERSYRLMQGECDLVMAVVDGQSGYLTSIAYYRSTYVFVYPETSGFEIASFDDAALRELRIGVQLPDGRNVSPPTQALANRGLIPNQKGYLVNHAVPESIGEVIRAVAAGEVDIAVAWGPVAGYYAQRQATPLRVVPVSPEIELPFLPMVFAIAIGVRPGDEELRDLINVALARRWEEVQAVLREFGVPLLPLPAPTPTLDNG